MTINTLDELYAELLANLPVAIWAYNVRTLTNVGATLQPQLSGSLITIYRDTSVSFSLTNLGNIVEADNLWFTVKDFLEKPDSLAIIQIDLDGLKYIAGQSADDPANGGITVQDATLGNIDIGLEEIEAAKLPLTSRPVLWDVKMLKDGEVSILATGTMQIKGTPTRSIS